MKSKKSICKRSDHKWEIDSEKGFMLRKCKICGLKQNPLITENVLIDGFKWINADSKEDTGLLDGK